MKVCNDCGNNYPEIKKYWYKTRYGSLSNQCKECRKKNSLRYYILNKNRISEKNKQKYKNNPEKWSEWHKKY